MFSFRKKTAGWTLLCAVAVARAEFRSQQPMQVGFPVIDDNFGKYIEEMLVNHTIHGLSVGIVRPDGVIETGGWGERTESGDAFTPDTLMAVASVSKAFVSASMGILMDDFAKGTNVTSLPPSIEVFDLETKIDALLPEDWGLDNACSENGTNVRDLLSHSTGLPDHSQSHFREESPPDIVARLRHLRTSTGLRHSWLYSNMMYMTGTHIIKKYSGMSYEDFVTERIFKPLGMQDSTYSPKNAEATGKFSQSFETSGRRIPHAIDDQIAPISAGGGGCITNVADLSRWLQMFLHQGVDPVTNKRILPQSTYDAVTSPASIIPALPGFQIAPVMVYGLGWMRNTFYGMDMIWHAGAIPGVSALAALFPEINTAVVVLANADNKSDATIAIGGQIITSIVGQLTDGQTDPEDSTASMPMQSRTAGRAQAISLMDLAGTYSDPGYGTFNLCAPGSSSSYCHDVISNFSTVDGSLGDTPQLLAASARVWSSHIRFTQHSDNENVFDVRFTTLYPQGYGKDTSPFEMMKLGEGMTTAEFVRNLQGQVIGFGLFGVAGEVTNRMRAGGTVQERADAWMAKVPERRRPHASAGGSCQCRE
ncbi:beta-lactamase/transpeptidase-like protein [Punctularia strigosozonata HHB-11173 SS5]|uniref:beta-lactamase/transpeptidase-like protein n=1 Tax=Punctularia strigosozonata (strain HHB-11173) TaxID=741275 RepID=UPI000441690C|nr:beta-lactamase/transpeptidase-like protein [Punctularia strigosozonata HHB-11173 SS5]EIN06835.1 beta-lactamase/transpeptidase-like protein [Punctularia strigosozonata HHB-11173 SS5]